MNLPNFRSICVSRHTVSESIRNLCIKCIPSCLLRHHQVHPINPDSNYCEFLQLHPHRKIRVIHFTDVPKSSPINDVSTVVAKHEEEEAKVPQQSDTDTDEYWFVRCSHSSFRLANKKSTNPSIISSSSSVGNSIPLTGGPLDNVRYSFHRKGKLKPCIEEEVEPLNQDNTVKQFIDTLVHEIMKDALSEAVCLAQNNQRCIKTDENISSISLPQEKANDTPVTCDMHNGKGNFGKSISEIASEKSRHSGCSNIAFEADEPDSTSDNNSSEIKTTKPLDIEHIDLEVGSTKDTIPSNDNFENKNGPVVLSEFAVEPLKGEATEKSKKFSIKNNRKTLSKKSSKKSPSKPLLLFLHGVGNSADIWSPLLKYFAAAGYEVVAPDMLGHGFSSAPDSPSAYTFPCLLQDALQIFDTFVSESRKCVVVGHAYGSSFAAAIARYRPQSVVQVVLISGGGPTPLAPRRGIYALPTCLRACAKPLLLCGFRREYFYSARGKQLFFVTEARDLPSYVLTHVEQGQTWPQGDAAFHRRISVPVLLVHGMQDPHITLVEECEMERTIPRSFLEVISTAGHMTMLDAPNQLCHMLHCFITLWDKGLLNQ